MAINGSITARLHDTFNLYIDFKWKRTSFSQTSNTSTISWEIILRDEALIAYFNAGTVPISLNIAGVTTSEVVVTKSTSSIKSFGSFTGATGTRTIPHNADGTKDFNVYFEFAPNSLSISDTKTVVSGSFTLDRITRASGVTCTTVNIGTAPVITIDSQDSTYKHTLTYGFGNQEQGYITGTIASLTKKVTIDDFIWPESFYTVMTNSKSGEGTIFCTTYNDFNYPVGEQTRCNFTVRANEGSSTPVFESGYPIIKDINSVTKALTGDDSKLVRYVSTAYVEIGAKGRNLNAVQKL